MTLHGKTCFIPRLRSCSLLDSAAGLTFSLHMQVRARSCPQGGARAARARLARAVAGAAAALKALEAYLGETPDASPASVLAALAAFRSAYDNSHAFALAQLVGPR